VSLFCYKDGVTTLLISYLVWLISYQSWSNIGDALEDWREIVQRIQIEG